MLWLHSFAVISRVLSVDLEFSDTPKVVVFLSMFIVYTLVVTSLLLFPVCN